MSHIYKYNNDNNAYKSRHVNNSNINDNILKIFTDASSSIDEEKGYYNTKFGFIIVFNNNYISSDTITMSNRTSNYGELKAIEFAMQTIIENGYITDEVESIEFYTDSIVTLSLIEKVIGLEGKDIITSKRKITENMGILRTIYKIVNMIKKPINFYFIFSHGNKRNLQLEYKRFKLRNELKRYISFSEFVIIFIFNDLCDKMVKPV